MFSKTIILLVFVLSPQVWASYEEASKIYEQSSASLNGYYRVVKELTRDKFYFASIPWMKDYLVKSKGIIDSRSDDVLDEIITNTGVKPFEALPEDIIRRSKSGHMRFILGKKLFKNNEPNEALLELNRVSTEHDAFPFVANLKGVIQASLGNNSDAAITFKECIRFSEKKMGDFDSQHLNNQYWMNRDYCIAGLARVNFSGKNFLVAESNYLDIAKESFVWPEILFEEAWNSYYQKNYNRTLGKLISYRAPVFDFVFNPEVEVLKALTYLKMCLYDDAKRTVNGFYDDYQSPAKKLRDLVQSRGKDYRYYYNLLADFEEKRPAPLPILDSILRSINKDAAVVEMKSALALALAEYNNVRKRSNNSLKTNMVKNLQTVLDEYRTIIGAYVRAGIVSKYADLYNALQGMSYIKLEVLAQRKEKLYQSDVVPGKKRGDVKYIDRNDKQYFWTFNGEFWADELGDYVFALRSEC